MSNWNRRRVVGSAAALSALPSLLRNGAAAGSSKPPDGHADPVVPKPFVHCTDLFRPHDDPDDHWDLATGYALACQDELDLAGVLTDNPLNVDELPENIASWNKHPGGHVDRSPDIAAVAQLNYITDRTVPFATGPVWPGRPGAKVRVDNLPTDLSGVHMLLNILKQSPHPVAILTGGSCQNVAIAGIKDSRLFAEKFAGIYLSAGTGSQDPKEQTAANAAEWPMGVEWNVSLNRGAYATIFELPCPIYWMPCFNGMQTDGEYGASWSFRQKEVLPYLSQQKTMQFMNLSR